MRSIFASTQFRLHLTTILAFFPYFFVCGRRIRFAFHLLANDGPEAELWDQDEPLWMHSGKFQGDIDGVDFNSVKQNSNVMYNALRNRQLTWPAHTLSEVKLLQRAFKTYRKKTCIRFRPRKGEVDFLNIVKDMDRDEHILIRWENILPGMDSQFDIVSSAIQDTQGEKYDYRSIMHYGSSAFSRNGRNTIEAVMDDFTEVIGTAVDLSDLDVIKQTIPVSKKRAKEAITSNGSPKNRRKTTTDSTNMATTSTTHPPPTSTATNRRFYPLTRATPRFIQLKTNTKSPTTTEASTSSLELGE
uniref:Peptidase M12A domain-containing protein n=1 Tax=Ditylenchus dipsaci TaxID=166011 RepID=A0A915CNM0_9BILA